MNDNYGMKSHLTKHTDSLAPPTQPTRPEKNKLKPSVMTE